MTEQENLERVIPDQEARRICGNLSRSTWQRLEKAGLLPPRVQITKRIGGRRYSDLLEWIAERVEQQSM